MVRVTLSVRKTLDEVAAAHFEAAKKARRKTVGAKQTIERVKQTVPTSKPKVAQEIRKKEWYERFRWSRTNDGSLLVGGRDASTNEVLLKKYLDPTDLVFHTDSPGSPFFLLKGPHTALNKQTAAQLCACYSKAWAKGFTQSDVFAVRAEQVSKTANAGESIGHGSFMIRGERELFTVPLTLALGMLRNVPMAGLPDVFAQEAAPHAILVPGKDLTSDVAKRLTKKIGATPDSWVSILPGGGSTLRGFHALKGSSAPPAPDENA